MSEAAMSPTPEAFTPDERLREALRAHFGYPSFRPGQEEIVQSVLAGRPTIAILPTGGGKSLCFQLPALLLEGTTIVISPLVALMKDQVDALTARGIAATFINSSLADDERSRRQASLRKGSYKLVYVAPERFRSSGFLDAMAGVRCPLMAVDEAHCISSWGHDFRPEYQRLAQAHRQLGAERILALTATATPEVRQDIVEGLELREPNVFVTGFDRPNLFIEVAKVSGDRDKLGRLFALARTGAPGLVYAATRKNVEKVVAAMQTAGIRALGYHAGMEDQERASVQEAFLEGKVPVIVATNAFGMGIDKSDIRFVAHFDIPRSLEAYYQEIGRAGRDGQPSLAVLLFNYADVLMQRRIIDSSAVDEKLVRRVWDDARGAPQGSAIELARHLGAHPAEVQSALKLLEKAGHVARRGDRSYAVLTPQIGPSDIEVPFDDVMRRVQRERQMLDRLVRFTDTDTCRRQNLLRYFGDRAAGRTCPSCDCCVGSRAPKAEDVPETKRRRDKPLSSAVAATAAEEGPYDAAVFEALRNMRLELARELRVPPYVIFHDATLRELARAMPANEKEFLAVKGAGPSKWEKFGAKVVAITSRAQRPSEPPVGPQPDASPAKELKPPPPLPPPVRFAERDEEIAQYGRPRPLASRPPPLPPPPALAASPSGGPPWEAVWALHERGLALQQIADARRDSVSAVAALLAEAALAGRAVDVDRLLGAERVAAIRRAAGSDEDLVAVRRRLDRPASFGEIRLALVGGAAARA